MKILKIILRYKVIFLCLFVFFVTFWRITLNKPFSLKEDSEVEVTLKVKNIKKRNEKYTIFFDKFISYYNDNFPYDVGDTVKIKGKVKKIKQNTILNLFNYKEYLQSNNIQYELEISEIKLIKKNGNILNKIKSNIEEKIQNYPNSEYMYAFIMGDISYLSDETKKAYQINGLSYLLCIGSLQVGIVIKILEKTLKKYIIKEHYLIIIIGIILFFYSFLTNYVIGIVRSSLCYLLKRILNYYKIKISNFLINIYVLLFLLFLNPFYIYRVGFYYSFIISISISLLSKQIEGNKLKKMFLFSSIAFLVSLPITIYVNYEINFLTIFLSILIMPIFVYILYPLSFVTFLLPFLSFLWNISINLLEKMNMFFSNINLFSVVLRKPSVFLVVIYYVILFLFFKNRKYFILLVLLLFIHHNINHFMEEKFVLFLDVSQGDAILIKNNSEVSLIDTGGGYNIDYSERIITYVKSLGLNKINNLLLTHGDYDHMGNAISLVNNFKVEKVVFNCGEYNALEKELINVLKEKRINYYSCVKEIIINNNKLAFLNTKIYNNENNNSNVIYTELNGYKFMFMGDAGVEKEKDILYKYDLSDIDVLKVGHHGSKTSSGKSFIDEINPKYSIISVGKNNKYGHPNKEVLNNLKDSKIYRTDEDGSIMFKIESKKLKIETCKPLS